jgi:hypothetical protein
MRFLLVALCLLAAGAEKPAPTQQKSTPSQPKKRRTAPTPDQPAGPPRTEKTKTAMAAAAPKPRLCGHDLDRTG